MMKGFSFLPWAGRRSGLCRLNQGFLKRKRASPPLGRRSLNKYLKRPHVPICPKMKRWSYFLKCVMKSAANRAGCNSSQRAITHLAGVEDYLETNTSLEEQLSGSCRNTALLTTASAFGLHASILSGTCNPACLLSEANELNP